MGSLDDLPERPRAHDVDTLAQAAFAELINSAGLFVVRSEERHDYGTDYRLEARDGSAMSNCEAQVQLKGTEGAPNADGSVSVSLSRTSFNYLLMAPNSFYLCFHVPTRVLLYRVAGDVFAEYERRGTEWRSQKTITVRFDRPFDSDTQRSLHGLVLASGRASRDERLKWDAAPPEKMPTLIDTAIADVAVPPDPERAYRILRQCYDTGHDQAIALAFDKFRAVLGGTPGALDMAYMAEINLGLYGRPFSKARVRDALPVLRAALDRGDVTAASIHYCLGNAFLALEEPVNAVGEYEAAIASPDSSASAPLMAQCRKNMGAARELLGDRAGARVLYEEALRLDPDLSEAHYAMAMLERKAGSDPQTVLAHLDRVVGRSGSALTMTSVRGWRMEALFKKGDTEAAFRELRSLISEATKAEWIWSWCARQVAAFGGSSVSTASEALAFWRAYLRHDPTSSAARRYRLLTLCFLRMRDVDTDITFEQFRTEVVALIEAGDPRSPFLWDRIGHWAQCDDDWGNAEAAFRKAYEAEPEAYGYCLGTALNELDRFADALPILMAQADKHQPDAMSWFQVGVAHAGLRDGSAAIAAFQKAIELDPDYDHAWFNLGGEYWNSRNFAAAAETWREALRRFPTYSRASEVLKDFGGLLDLDS